VLSWLFPLLGILLLFSGAGNPWFIQEREGLQGRPFKVLKFKTMNHEGQSNALQSWMRKTGIDEIPQLLNVLLGQMSLVGPRPHTSGDGIAYSKMVQSYRVRYWTKPGLTGLAQIRGLRGGGDSARKELLELRIRADVYYIENWSLLLDLRILIETVLRTLLAPSSLHAK
jgi:lipopolysaccharide/colanic/teichoic acid biosynthesis glycosyltransferase